MTATITHLPRRKPALVALRSEPAVIIILPVVRIEQPPTPSKKKRRGKPTNNLRHV